MLVIDDGKEIYFQNGLSMVAVDHALLDRMDGIRPSYKDEEHIHASKYESRLSIVSRICDALDEQRTCSVLGNGATSLANKLTTFVKTHLKFRRFAMVTVSRNPNLKEIEKSIIQQIGKGWTDNCTLILDGFWWELRDEDFEEIGIHSPRIVYISRNEGMCKKIKSHHIFHINFLEDEEAWDLFAEKAGKAIVDWDSYETARRIVDECDGFRIAILTVASTLKDKPPNVWKDSLMKLQNSNRACIGKVFSMIRLSYDLLSDKEAQLLFCVCCLFPEDFSIPVEDLVLFGKGLQLFENVDSMDQARDRVEFIIHKLKDSFFLVDGDEDEFVKVHDMVRDFGVSISSKFEHPYVARCDNGSEEWPLESTEYENSGAISLFHKTIKKHPVDLKCPNLHLLQLSYGSDSARLPKGIFQGLQNLKVLSLSIPSLSQPLTVLEKLRTLCITESILDNRYKKPRPRIGDLLGDEMKDLESFSFSTARPYDDFPKEIGLLCNLRFLRFDRERLKYIPVGVLSKLVKLEELCLPQDFIGWGCKQEGGDRMNASLSEIESLLQLTALRIGVPKGSILAEKLVKKLTRFHVFMGSHVGHDYEFDKSGNSKKILEVFDVDADDFRASWISALVWKSESLRLKQVRNLKNFTTREPKEDENIEIPQWKKICISDCKELEYLASGNIPWASFSQLESLKLFGLSNMKEIWQGLYLSKIEGSCFGNLGEIQIMFCRKLKYMFSVSVATQLRQLQSLQICFCDEMEQIFYRQQMDNDGDIQSSDPTVETTPTMNPTVNTSVLRKSMLGSLKSNPITKRLFGRGKQPKFVTSQQQTDENIGKEDEQDVAKDDIIFPKLKTMELAYMVRLGIFYNGNQHSMLLPSLESLSIFRCNHLEAFCYGLLKTPLLHQIRINGNLYSVTQDLNAILKNLNPFFCNF